MLAHAIPTDQLHINLIAPFYKYPVLNDVFAARDLDALEYCMGLRRGDVPELMKSHMSKARLRMDLVKLMTRDKLALVPDEDILALMLDKLTKNYHQGKLGRVRFSEFFPMQDLYTYRLFFAPGLTIYGPNGEPCVSGVTLVETPLHPCLSLHATMKYFISSVEHRPQKETSLWHYSMLALLLQKHLPWTWCMENETCYAGRPALRVFDDRDQAQIRKEGSLEEVLMEMRRKEEKDSEERSVEERLTARLNDVSLSV